MLDDLQRDTFNLMGLAIASFGFFAFMLDKFVQTKSGVYLVASITSMIGTFIFAMLAAKGAGLMISRGLSKFKPKSQSISSIETSFMRLKKAILELKDGYPEYEFYGKIEYFVKTGKWAVDLLDNHGIIEKISLEDVKKRISLMSPEELSKLPSGEDRFRWYRLTAKGVDLAISMINLEYGERTLEYTKSLKFLTWVLVSIGLITLIAIGIQIVLAIWLR